MLLKAIFVTAQNNFNIMRTFLFLQSLFIIVAAFQSKKHGEYKVKVVPDMFYRIVGTFFCKYS